MITFEQVADWILANRRRNAFIGYEKHEIVAELMERVDYDLAWVHEINDKILGVVTADQVDVNNRPTIFVRNCLIVDARILPMFLEKYKQNYPGFPMTARHHGKIITVNVDRVLRVVYRQLCAVNPQLN